MAEPFRVVTIFSTKGGVGKTVIAVNLAATLSVHFKKSVALIDLTSVANDAKTMLGSTKVHCVSNIATSEALSAALTELQQQGSTYVVIDGGSVLSELALTAFEQSNLLLMVTTPDLVAINHAQKTIELFERMRFPLQMMKVVLNRADSRGNIRTRDVIEQFPVEVIADIPSDGRLVGVSVNRWQPLVTFNSGSRIEESFKHLGKMLLETTSYVEHFAIDRTALPVPAVAPTTGLAMLYTPDAENGPVVATKVEDPLMSLKRKVHLGLLERIDIKRVDLETLKDPLKNKPMRERVEREILEFLTEEHGFVQGVEERQRLVKEIADEALGLGPLEDLMADDAISDILVNGKDQIYVERHGRLELTTKRFLSNDQVHTVIERIIAPLGRRIDESVPMVDARLPDGSRVNAIIAPLSIRGPMLSIRKFGRELFTMDRLVQLGTLSEPMAEFLSICVAARKNIIVSGGTGSGKTTVLNVLSSDIPKGERIITIEDAAELRLFQEHWIPLEARPSNIEGKGSVTVRNLFRNALRMRPDRIVIGECRGDETLDMLQAMNTGHDGSLTTLHANSPQDVIARLDSMVLMSNVDLPVRAVREQIASAIDLIVHTARLSDGSRRITHITEVTGMADELSIHLENLFVFRQEGLDPENRVVGRFKPTGTLPSFLEELKTKGVHLDEAMFFP